MSEPCRYCEGIGRVGQQWTDPNGGEIRREVECPACKAAGDASCGVMQTAEGVPQRWWQFWKQRSGQRT